MPIVEDLAPLFSDLAVTAALNGGAATPVYFDAPGTETEIGVITLEPSIVVRASLWPTARAGDTVVTGGITYLIRQAVPEGDGATLRIALARA